MSRSLRWLADNQGAHSIFSPSSASLWMNCPGGLVANAVEPDKTSYDAAEGSVAHLMGDKWLRSGERPTSFVGQIVVQDGYDVLVTDGMLAYVEQYVDWVQDCPGEMYYETRVDLSWLLPIPTFGTADHFSCSPGHLTITDLKYGKGIRVEAKDNPQLLLYALGVFNEWDWYYGFQTIDIRVAQPRLDHRPVWRIDRADLLAFAERVRAAGDRAWRLDAPRSPSEKSCQWCRTQAKCPAYLTWFAALRDAEADLAFDVPGMRRAADDASDLLATEPPIDLPELSIEACAAILPMRGVVEKWFAEIEQRLFNAALIGEVPGYKIVQGRSTRQWASEHEAEKRLKAVGIDDPYIRKLMSPNQAEEELHATTGMKKKAAHDLLDTYTVRAEGVRTLARVDDKREAVERPGDIFDTYGDL